MSVPLSASTNEKVNPITVEGRMKGRKTTARYWRQPRIRSLSTSAISSANVVVIGTVAKSFKLFSNDCQKTGSSKTKR